MQIKIMALAGVRDMYYSFTAVSNSCNCLKKNYSLSAPNEVTGLHDLKEEGGNTLKSLLSEINP